MNESREKKFNGFSSAPRFERAAFLSPSLDYAPIYTWMWNGKITRGETDRRLDEMARLGIKRFYILPMPKSFRPTSFPTPLEPEYLSAEYFEAYRYAIEGAKVRGMQVWLYDEGGWPSGGACGQVMLEDPTLVSETIRTDQRTIGKGEPYEPDPSVEAAFAKEKRISKGESFPSEIVVTEYRRVSTSFPKVNSADLPDITKKGATETFLRLTHDNYAASLGEYFGDTITALFTDEPTAPRPFPYNDEIKDIFRKTFGEEIEGYLPVLMGNAKTTEKSAQIKIKFFDLLSDLFCDRFLEKEKAWARAYSLAYLGHLDKDDEANGSMTGGSFGLLRALRRFDVPGVDAIRRQIFPPRGKRGYYAKNGFFPLLASSAAAQTGGRHALSESFAVYGNGLTYDEMRYVLNFQAMRGVNVFNMMVTPYSRKGYLSAGLLPHFTEKTYPHLSSFNDYASRLSYLFSLGERVARVALYFPIADGFVGEEFEDTAAAYEEAGNELTARRIPFDLIDDDFLSFAKEEGGKLVAGRASYEIVVIPPCRHLSKESKSMLARFIAAGGRVLTISDTSEAIAGAERVSDLSRLSSPLDLPLPEGITLAETRVEEGTLFFLMNEGDGEQSISAARLSGGAYLIDPTESVIRSIDETPISLPSGALVGLLLTDREIPHDEPIRSMKIKKTVGATYRPIEKLTFDGDYRTRAMTASPRPIADPAKAFPPDFSGRIEYAMQADLPVGTRKAVLDLGKVVHAAEVLWNGESVGTKVLSPYRFEIPPRLLKAHNEIVIRVTGTPRNEYERTRVFDSYRPWQLGNYLKEEREFHRDSEESGLFGEVKVFYE